MTDNNASPNQSKTPSKLNGIDHLDSDIKPYPVPDFEHRIYK